MSGFHPDLAWFAPFLPRSPVGPRLLPIVRALMPSKRKLPSSPGLTGSIQEIPGGQTARVFVPEGVDGPMPVMLWIHGGGFLIGAPWQDDAVTMAFARELKMVVVASSYRLAPEHPFPAALDDLYAALKWIHAGPHGLPIRPDRIVIAGASAGGGLAAGLTLMARDRKEIPVAFQLLVYPMLDDRTVSREIDGTNHRLWSAPANRFGWTSYLGHPPGAEASPYAAPARVESVAGLPPTWIGVGTFDLFHDEDVAYAKRLEAAGVTVKLEVIDGAFHGFDAIRSAKVSRDFLAGQIDVLRQSLR